MLATGRRMGISPLSPATCAGPPQTPCESVSSLFSCDMERIDREELFTILLNAPAWARVGLTMNDERMRVRANRNPDGGEIDRGDTRTCTRRVTVRLQASPYATQHQPWQIRKSSLSKRMAPGSLPPQVVRSKRLRSDGRINSYQNLTGPR